MPKVAYLAYNFVKPKALSEEDFLHLKNRQRTGIPFDLTPKRNASHEFASEIRTLKITFAISVISMILSGASQFFAAIGGIAFLIFIILFFSFLNSKSSFKSLMKKERKFYQELHKIIYESSSYNDFYFKFLWMK